MMQKDPKFRYPSCEVVAETLEAWLEKYRKEQAEGKLRGSGSKGSDASSSGSRIEYEDGQERTRPEAETVSNRGGDTFGGKTGNENSITSLSYSDSGIIKTVEGGGSKSDAGSTVDLEQEMARRAKAARSGNLDSRGSLSGVSNSALSSVRTKAVSPVKSSAAMKPVAPVTFSLDEPRKQGVPKWLMAVGLALIILVSVIAGVFLAKFLPKSMTSDRMEHGGVGIYGSFAEHSRATLPDLF